MTLIDEERFHLITAYFKDLKTYKAAGGSAGNAIGALASLEAPSGFIGKIGSDSYGDFLKSTLESGRARSGHEQEVQRTRNQPLQNSAPGSGGSDHAGA